jgi:hypothetical protein
LPAVWSEYDEARRSLKDPAQAVYEIYKKGGLI